MTDGTWLVLSVHDIVTGEQELATDSTTTISTSPSTTSGPAEKGKLRVRTGR